MQADKKERNVLKTHRIFFILLLVAALIYLIFILSYDKYNRLNEQKNVNNHANIISYSLWSYDPDLAKDYLKLACKANKYRKLIVLFSSNEKFISIDHGLDNDVDAFLNSLSLFRVLPLKSKISHKGKVIGEISVQWYNTAIYTYFYVLVIIILLLIIIWFFLATIKHKNELEYRVEERTIDLSKEIKERRQAEETKRKILEASIGGIYIYDLDLGLNIYINTQYTALTGYTLKALKSMDSEAFLNLFHPDDQSEVFEHMRAVVEDLSDGKSLSLDYRFKHADGDWKWFRSCDAAYERDKNGRVRQFIGTFIDITDQKKSELHLKESEQRFRSLVVSSPQFIFMLQEGKFIYANPAGVNALGYQKDKDIMGLNILQIIAPEFHEIVVNRLNNIENKKVNPPIEIRMINSKGKSLWIIGSSVSVDFEGKRTAIFVGQDITERKKLERKLIQAQKMESVGQLAGGIAHDFNNILYPILGLTQMIMDDFPKTHKVQEDLKDILNGAKRARDLVKRILLFSRQKEQVLEPVFLKPLIKDTLKLLRSSIPANINIEQKLYDGQDHVLCDPTEINEIVMNLCTNAYHAIEDKDGTITVSLNKDIPDPDLKLAPGDYICLSVSDDGFGIPSAQIDKIYEPYFTTKEVGKGTGLGLSVVHGIVKNYKGDIHVTSRPGKGTTFKIFLPVTGQIDNDIQKQNQKSLGGNERILFVDDELSIMKLGVRVLEKKGYNVTGTPDPLKALSVFNSNPKGFDLVITDMAMPKMTGSALAQKILDTRPDIPIIICSGYSEKLDTLAAKNLNIKAFIDKPVLVEELTAKVRQVLDQI